MSSRRPRVKRPMKRHVRWLWQRGACCEACEFADEHLTMQAAWDACPNPSWLLWLMQKAEMPQKVYVRAWRLYFTMRDRVAEADLIRSVVPHFVIKEQP